MAKRARTKIAKRENEEVEECGSSFLAGGVLITSTSNLNSDSVIEKIFFFIGMLNIVVGAFLLARKAKREGKGTFWIYAIVVAFELFYLCVIVVMTVLSATILKD